ncbi:MAG: signal peptidase I [Pseudonocardiaceae bacterium]|nr:signal peptidase I [Pseudonocardiaceae bacterium]
MSFVAVPSTEPARGDDGGHRKRTRNRARHRKGPKRGSFWRELPILVITALVLTVLIQTFLARVYLIPSASMEQTLHGCTGCTNDRVLVDKVSYNFSDPEPGDVVVFRGPESWVDSAEFSSTEPDNVLLRGLQEAASLIGLAPPDERDFVKRVIAVGGQTVECCDERNRVVVDGEPLVEPYIYLADGRPQADFAPVTVPEGNLWMMGDNRNNSADSRSHVADLRNGTIPIENVIGEARLIVLPPSRWGGIEDPNPQRLQPVALGRGHR